MASLEELAAQLQILREECRQLSRTNEELREDNDRLVRRVQTLEATEVLHRPLNGQPRHMESVGRTPE